VSTQRQNITETDKAVSEAWALHYNGQHEAAVRAFQELVAANQEHIDANYGLALSLAGAGKRAESDAAFRLTKTYVEQTLQTLEGEEAQRYVMLKRMIDQHLTRLNAGQS
jgi:lipopolysaccharide biosynthesis regulator YciM